MISFLDRIALTVAELFGPILKRPSEATLKDLSGGPSFSIDLPPMPANLIENARECLENGNFGEALHLFKTVTDQNNNNHWAWHGRGDALFLMGSHQAALLAFKKAAAINQTEALHHAGMANALTGLGKLAEAEKRKEHALELDPNISWVWR